MTMSDSDEFEDNVLKIEPQLHRLPESIYSQITRFVTYFDTNLEASNGKLTYLQIAAQFLNIAQTAIYRLSSTRRAVKVDSHFLYAADSPRKLRLLIRGARTIVGTNNVQAAEWDVQLILGIGRKPASIGPLLTRLVRAHATSPERVIATDATAATVAATAAAAAEAASPMSSPHSGTKRRAVPFKRKRKRSRESHDLLEYPPNENSDADGREGMHAEEDTHTAERPNVRRCTDAGGSHRAVAANRTGDRQHVDAETPEHTQGRISRTGRSQTHMRYPDAEVEMEAEVAPCPRSNRHASRDAVENVTTTSIEMEREVRTNSVGIAPRTHEQQMNINSNNRNAAVETNYVPATSCIGTQHTNTNSNDRKATKDESATTLNQVEESLNKTDSLLQRLQYAEKDEKAIAELFASLASQKFIICKTKQGASV